MSRFFGRFKGDPTPESQYKVLRDQLRVRIKEIGEMDAITEVTDLRINAVATLIDGVLSNDLTIDFSDKLNSMFVSDILFDLLDLVYACLGVISLSSESVPTAFLNGLAQKFHFESSNMRSADHAAKIAFLQQVSEHLKSFPFVARMSETELRDFSDTVQPQSIAEFLTIVWEMFDRYLDHGGREGEDTVDYMQYAFGDAYMKAANIREE